MFVLFNGLDHPSAASITYRQSSLSSQRLLEPATVPLPVKYAPPLTASSNAHDRPACVPPSSSPTSAGLKSQADEYETRCARIGFALSPYSRAPVRGVRAMGVPKASREVGIELCGPGAGSTSSRSRRRIRGAQRLIVATACQSRNTPTRVVARCADRHAGGAACTLDAVAARSGGKRGDGGVGGGSDAAIPGICNGSGDSAGGEQAAGPWAQLLTQYSWAISEYDPLQLQGISQYGPGQWWTDAPVYEIKNMYHRKIMDVVKEAFEDEHALEYHMHAHKLMWTRSKHDLPMRCWGETYTSDRAQEMEEELENLEGPDGCDLERVPVWAMLFSDSTHLTNFGNASMWPVYLALGNLSKYTRGKPTSYAQHHIAYIPSIPDDFDDWYLHHYNKKAPDYIKTHMKRELMQAVWRLLLDDGVVESYEHGSIMHCADEIVRRAFLRFFSYSTDYVEKVLVVCLKFLGKCLCPRCMIEKKQVRELGMIRDMRRRERTRRVDTVRHQARVKSARKLIFESGRAVNGEPVDDALRNDGSTPISNAFSEKLFPLGFDHFKMHPVDMLHDFEVGEWKAIFAHLVRMLYSMKGDLVQELNRRFRNVPTFLRDAIRRFANNVAEMKKLAGHNFEDILQTAMPCFEKLFPNKAHQKIVLDMLFDLGHWHGLAKLRLHTESTMASLDYATRELGKSIRSFENIASTYDTRELPGEAAARVRRKQKAAAKSTGQQAQDAGPVRQPASESVKRVFDRKSYKKHSLGDYAWAIRYWGTTDNVSTQWGEMEHRRIKRYYSRTNKNEHAVQIARFERRDHQLRAMKQQKKRQHHGGTLPNVLTVAASAHEPLPASDPSNTTHISKSLKFHEHVTVYLGDRLDDPALKTFLCKLKEHLLSRVRESSEPNIEYTAYERNQIVFEKDRIYKHKTIRASYTSYDVRRKQDPLNPSNHADIMVLSDGDDEHPYWYGRILGVFHAHVLDLAVPGSRSQRWEFVYVRWFSLDRKYRHGFRAKRHPRVHFMHATSSEAFGFIDPKDIVRAVHAVPAFAHGRTADYLAGPTIARPQGEVDDYKFHYISMFADRDTLMRFRGGGVGHKATREATRELEAESERLAGFRQPKAEPTSCDDRSDVDGDAISDDGDDDEDWVVGGQAEDDEDEEEEEENEEGEEDGNEDEDDGDDAGWEDVDSENEMGELTAESLGYADW
ncbi:hypothetical protein BD626DRAFT_627628 [Schizophyllum amplum]|uniref:Uncharacterized protein n=1 Tax=Schizophyllum amplum TaxID=97359 RepID=A0A550CQZ6_9AGAR|nr:hypothetical protein BD626DRAFT_627628 [Auriculariopsis ampla]